MTTRERHRRRTASRAEKYRTEGRRRDEGEDRKEREHGCVGAYTRARTHVPARVCTRERSTVCVYVRLVCARAGTTESTERNTEKTLVKGKRPLCLPFQSNRPPLSPLSFSLCPRFGSSRSLPTKPTSQLSLSLSLGRDLSVLLSLSPSLPPAASPLPGFLFVLPPSSDPGLTHPEEPENFAVFRSPLSLYISSPLFSSSLPSAAHPAYLERAKEGSIKTAMAEGERRREEGKRRFSFFALPRVPFLLSFHPSSPLAAHPLSLSPSYSLSLSLHPLTSPGTIQSNHPNLSSSLAAFRSTFAHTSSSSSSFYLPAPVALLASPSRPTPLLPRLGFAVLLLHLRLCSFIVVVSRLSPSPPCSSSLSSIAGIPRSFARWQPSCLSRPRLSFSFFRRSARPVSSLKRTEEEQYDAQRTSGRRERETRRD